jgi:hypothetical protein
LQVPAHRTFSGHCSWHPYQAEVIELVTLAERRHRIEDYGRMLRERVQEIEQQRADRAAERRLLEGVNAL